MTETLLKIGVAGNRDTLNRIESWLTSAMQQYLPPRRFTISNHDPFPPGQSNTEMSTLVRPPKGLGAIQSLHHRSGTIARVMLERNPDIDVMIRIDSGGLQMDIPKPSSVYHDSQYGVVATLATRLKGAGAIMLYSSLSSQGYLGGSGVGHRQETAMSEVAMQGVLPRWWMELSRGVHRASTALAA